MVPIRQGLTVVFFNEEFKSSSVPEILANCLLF